MIDLNSIISTFLPDQQKKFVAFLLKKNKRSDTKNIALFKLLIENKLNSQQICEQLYPNKSKDAYHALRKRLYHSMIEFVANSNIENENSEDMRVVKYILASRSFLLHNHYELAYKILDKAEKIAKENYLYAVLNEIYHTKIQFAYANPSIDVDVVVSKFRANEKSYALENQLNIVYAKIRKSVNDFIYRGEVVDFESLLVSNLDKYNIDIDKSLSFKSLYQLMTIVSISAFSAKDYTKVAPFLTKTYIAINTQKDALKQPYYHIQVLFLVANSLFRNKKFSKSIDYLVLMEAQMLLNNKKYYNTFILKYKSLLALNYNFSNQKEKAISLLENNFQKKHSDIESLLVIKLSLVMCYIQSKEYNKAHNIFSKLNHSDAWYELKVGREWVVKKNLIEIILHIELQNVDLVASKLLSFKRKYFTYLREINQQRVVVYLGLIAYYFKYPEKVTTASFFKKVEKSFEWVDNKREDIIVMSFYAWLKSKMQQTDLYMTTLGLVNPLMNNKTL